MVKIKGGGKEERWKGRGERRGRKKGWRCTSPGAYLGGQNYKQDDFSSKKSRSLRLGECNSR